MESELSNLFFCEICNIRFNGATSYEAHVTSSAHEREVANTLTLNEPDDNFYVKTGTAYIFCKICNTSVTGIIPWQQHITGKQHAKKIQTRKLIASVNKDVHQESYSESNSYSDQFPTVNQTPITENKMASNRNNETADIFVKINVSVPTTITNNSVESKITNPETEIYSLFERTELMQLNGDNNSLTKTTIHASLSSPHKHEMNLLPFQRDTGSNSIESFQEEELEDFSWKQESKCCCCCQTCCVI